MFKPYEIQHIQISDVKTFAPPVGKHYLVFWYNQYPLGHIWYENNLDQPAFETAIITAISPALNYYLKLVDSSAEFDWQNGLFTDDFGSSELDRTLANMTEPPALTQTITVVICTRNRPKELRQCIEQLKRSNDQDFELLVVDNASDTEETERIVSAFGDVKYVREDRKGLDIARNTGVKNAKNSIVAFTDDDVVVDVDWITRIKEGFANSQTMALTGLTIPFELSTEAQYLFERDWGFNKGYLPRTFDKGYVNSYLDVGDTPPAWDVGAGANMAFRKDVFKVVGGFDERLDVGASGCSGDSEMWYRIMVEGWNCAYIPQMVVYHQHRKTMAELDNQLYYYMKGHVSALLVQYEKYGNGGDLKRVKKYLPEWYLRRALSFVKRGWFNSLWSLINNEVRGCIAGWKYYHRHSINPDTPLFELPNQVSIDQRVTRGQVTVVVTCYNYGQYLDQAIRSVMNQTYQGFQLIVVDDGSEDNTAEVCAAYPNVEYVHTQRVGVSMARNTGVLFSNGDYILFLDADDWLYPNALELQLYYLNEFPDIAFVAGGFDRVDEHGTILPEQPELKQHWDKFYQDLLMGNFIGMQSNTMYRRELFFDFYFDYRLNACEDYDLNLRISRYFPAFAHTQKIAAYRIHKGSVSNDVDHMRKQAQKVLNKQRHLLRSDEELGAFAQGVKNWDAYYYKNSY
ncbi:glycosyltransferase [Parapedobacter soli]|uniref:glycosyltransferase n=1 Tax=Parapedobacter soli TaxID=416955 RepID=UPI0021CA36DD|nr:glycosyltransferase [Parapedobacter soli]